MCCKLGRILKPPRRNTRPSPLRPGAVPSSASLPSPQLGRGPLLSSQPLEPAPRACPLGGAPDPNSLENTRNAGQSRTPSRLRLSCFQGSHHYHVSLLSCCEPSPCSSSTHTHTLPHLQRVGTGLQDPPFEKLPPPSPGFSRSLFPSSLSL